MPCLGTPPVRHENKIKASGEKCFFAVEPRTVFTSRSSLPAIEKDVLPALLLNFLSAAWSSG